MVITLIGYRGTGKTTAAAALGARLRWDSVDADDQIEQQAGKSIRDIFAEGGEPGFRDLERQTMQRLLTGTGQLVLAAGGGAILNEQTRQQMQAAGPVVWLRASTETILARLQTDSTTAERRPKLTAQGGREEIEELLIRREPLYRETADIVVETDERTIEQIVEEILAGLAPRLEEGAAG